MKEQGKGKSRMARLLMVLRLAAQVLLLLGGIAGAILYKQAEALGRAVTHPSSTMRFRAGNDFVFWKTGFEPSIPNEKHQALIERERRLRLDELIYFLETGKLDHVTDTGRWLVAGTLEDSWDHENLMRATRAIRLFAREEKKRKILASSEDSVFRAVFEEGLLSGCYPGSWASHVTSIALAKEQDKTGKSYKRRKREIQALSKALCVFGPAAAEVVMDRLEEAVTRVRASAPYECNQIVTVLNFLNGHTVSVVGRLVHILEPEYEKRKFRGNFSVARAIQDAVSHDPKGVNTIFSNSGIMKGSSEYQAIKNELARNIAD